ncbi:MAG TPA: serine hydrolase domain-containing protein [Mobilitalea sp.]|nr:serine hydrolase domain-containing protein [Mobilitalea sp.]
MNFDKITSYLDSLEAEGIPSVDCIIYKNHEPIYRHYNGYADNAKTKKIQGNELYLMFSATKLITMTAALQLVEKGRIDLDQPVSQYLPCYGDLKVIKDDKVKPAQKELLVRHLLSMQSGLDYDLTRSGIARILSEKGQKATTQELVNAFIESPLKFEPGEHFEYSLSHDVVGAIIEVVSGMNLYEYFTQYIFRPLEMKDTYFAEPINDNERLVAQYMYDNYNHESTEMELSCCYQLTENYESGGAGLISCAEDYGKLADTLANGGVSAKGIRILKEETINLMRTNQLGFVQREDLVKNMGRVGYGYGCGVQILLDPNECNAKAPIGVFGWDGAAGACIIMDPINHIALVYIQHVRGCGYAYSTIHPMLRDLLYMK